MRNVSRALDRWMKSLTILCELDQRQINGVHGRATVDSENTKTHHLGSIFLG